MGHGEQLAAQNLIPRDSQPFTPPSLTGSFSSPIGCGNKQVTLSLMRGGMMLFESPMVPVLAVIAREGWSHRMLLLGSGASKGKVAVGQASQVELCMASVAANPLQLTQTAAYSIGITPGDVTWGLQSSVVLPAAYAAGEVHMFSGDTADAAWNLAAAKSGSDTVYHGMVTGQLLLTNSHSRPLAVYSIASGVEGGPVAQAACGTPPPFQPPRNGLLTATASVTYQLDGAAAVGSATSTAAFQVDKASAGHVVSSQAGDAPHVPDGTGQQSYVLTLECAAAGSRSLQNEAVLLASTGQEVASSASLVQHCYDLAVRLGEISAPSIAKHHAYLQQQRQLYTQAGQNSSAVEGQLRSLQMTPEPATADVTYTVQYVRIPPPELASGGRPFNVSGSVHISNPAPLQAALESVTISIPDPMAASMPYSMTADCPTLKVAPRQTLACSWTAAPPFNPTGAQVLATARYINVHNGASHTNSTRDYTSAAAIIGSRGPGNSGEQSSGTLGQRRLQAQLAPQPQQVAGAGHALRRSQQPQHAAPQVWRSMQAQLQSQQQSHRRSLQERQWSFDPMTFLNSMWGASSSLTNTPHAAAPPAAAAAEAAPNAVPALAASRLAEPAAAPGAPVTASAASPRTHSSETARAARAPVPAAGRTSAALTAAPAPAPAPMLLASPVIPDFLTFAPPAAAAAAAATVAAPAPPLSWTTKALPYGAGSVFDAAAGVAVRLVGAAQPAGFAAQSRMRMQQPSSNTTANVSVMSTEGNAAATSGSTNWPRGINDNNTSSSSSSSSNSKSSNVIGSSSATSMLAPVIPKGLLDECIDASGDLSYSWDAQTTAEASALRLPINTAGNNTYHVSFVRRPEVLHPQLAVAFELQNPGSSPVAVAHATYVCVCIKSVPKVGHKWTNGSDTLAAGAAVHGDAPNNSTICTNTTYSFTASLGPLEHAPRCRLSSPATSSTTTAASPAASTPHAWTWWAATGPLLSQPAPCPPAHHSTPALHPLEVPGRLTRLQQRHPSSSQGRVAEEACLTIDRRLLGGRGAATPFFQLRNAKIKHTYGSILLAGSSNSSSEVAAGDVFIKTAQSYVAAQLNQLSGVVMPPSVRQAQVTLAAKYFSVVTQASSVKKDLQKKAAAAEAVLSSFNSGTTQGIPSCRQVQAA
ncbi:hypothetical protein COO60DRAFT_1697991 [Scenedesmus sp. NREL 46B-D3]|nr:hypothetical protein COO60DRAFT_1697991 [Scenedesmus sp. NREL 46B-D3]